MLFCAGGASSWPFRAPARLVPSCDTFCPLPGAWASAVPASARLTASATPVTTKRNDPLACCSMALSSSSDEIRRNACLLLELENDSGLNAHALDRGAVLDLRVIAPACDR